MTGFDNATFTAKCEEFTEKLGKTFKQQKKTFIYIIVTLIMLLITQGFYNTMRSSQNTVYTKQNQEDIEVLMEYSISKEQFMRCVKTFEMQFDYYLADKTDNKEEMKKINSEFKEFRLEVIFDKSYNMKFRGEKEE